MLVAFICFLASMAFVDFAGYWLHRLAHRPKNPLHKSHMTHHLKNYPPKQFFSTKYKTSGGDNLAIWLAPFGILYAIAILFFNIPHPVAILTGGGIIAGLNAMIHDLSHIENSIAWKWPILQSISKRHRIHHSKMRNNFGVIFSGWDVLFSTRYNSNRF